MKVYRKMVRVTVCFNVEHLKIANCCTDAVIAAFTDTYGMEVVGLSGIDGDRYER